MPKKALIIPGISGKESEAYGKGALVGLDGKIEHGSAIIHTMTFAMNLEKSVEMRKHYDLLLKKGQAQN